MPEGVSFRDGTAGWCCVVHSVRLVNSVPHPSTLMFRFPIVFRRNVRRVFLLVFTEAGRSNIHPSTRRGTRFVRLAKSGHLRAPFQC